MKNLKKIIKIVLVFLTLTSITTVFAQEEEINSFEYIKLKIDNTISFESEFENGYNVNSFLINSYFFPQNYNESQYLNDFQTSENKYFLKENIDSEYLQFNLKNDLSEVNSIENSFYIESIIDQPQIKTSVPYPNTNIDPKYDKYLEFSNLIDLDENIKNQASLLAQGETDTYIIAAKVAKWIREDINYDLSTLQTNPNQKSSQVFESKAGVCKEITHLFISMLRSLGIPAKVITGYAYTNSEEVIELVGSPWGGHAWAEVLIGDVWVPFDLTYNQYGFVDATHIVVDKSAEIRTSSVSLNASGYKFSIVPNSLKSDNTFEVLDKKQAVIDQGLDIQIEGPTQLSPESFGYLKTKITNEKDYYQIVFLEVAKTKEIELLDSPSKMLIFKPFETKEFYYRYKIPKLDEGYSYTFPFKLYSKYIEEEFEVKVQEDYETLNELSLPEVLVEEKQFSNNKIQINCNAILEKENNLLLCTLKNVNNFEAFNVETCIREDCILTNLRVNEEKTINFNTQNFNEEITIEFQDQIDIVNVNIPKPTFEINHELNLRKLNLDGTLNDNNNLDLEIEINLNSEKIKSILTNSNFNEEFNFEPGNKTIEINLIKNNQIMQTKNLVIEIPEYTLWEKIIKFFQNLF